MNLTPDWTDYLIRSGHDAVHWSDVGPADAPDAEIIAWAREHDRIVLTNDLDFGAILAVSGSSKPSVVQLRSSVTLPDRVGSIVLDAIEQARLALADGALLSVEVGRHRLRLLPLDTKR